MPLAFDARRLSSRHQEQIEWRGTGAKEKGNDRDDGPCIVAVDAHYLRPTEFDSKARAKLGWKPKKSLKELVRETAQAGLESAERDQLIKHHGFKIFEFRE
jgi:GDPmannose 4,6-dehydratase